MKPIVSKNIRIRHPDEFEIGDGSIVDDFCYFSTRVKVGRYSHVANNCSVAGGGARLFTLGDFSSLSAGVRIWCTSDDFVNDIVMILPQGISEKTKKNTIPGDVRIGNYTAVGCNSVIMPGNKIPEGTVIGAMSYVPPFSKLKPWTVYAGVPARPIKPRNKESVERQIEQIEKFLKSLRGGRRNG